VLVFIFYKTEFKTLCVQLLILTEKIRVYRVERVEIMRVKRGIDRVVHIFYHNSVCTFVFRFISMKLRISIQKGFCDKAVGARSFRLDFNLILC
jgi:hypothetical protein